METKNKNIEFIFPDDMKQSMQNIIKEKSLEPFIAKESSDTKEFFDQFSKSIDALKQLTTQAEQIKTMNNQDKEKYWNLARNFNQQLKNLNKTLKTIK